MKTILVTGGAGFIGSNLCEKLLSKGFYIINLDNFNNFYDPLIKRANIKNAGMSSDYKLIEGDINDCNLLLEVFKSFDIDVVVHLAAMAGVRQSLGNPQEYIDVDIKGTVNLLEFCKKFKTKKFIFASSSSVYGKNESPFKETDSIELQISPYAAAKRAGEIFCKTYNELYGISTVVLRFFTVYGPRQRPEMAISKFVRLIDEAEEVPVYGDGSFCRDFTYVEDITDGIIASIDYNSSFEVFNLGNSSMISIKDLISLIEDKLGKTARINYLPEQQGDVKLTCADITRSEKLLGFKPKTKIDEGIEKYIKWYKAIKVASLY
jgi:UDP-glucuronate 4-epimerase